MERAVSCFTVVRRDEVRQVESAARALQPCEERCGGCGRHLLAVFVLDLRDPKMGFLGLEGTRLRLTMCPTFGGMVLYGGGLGWVCAVEPGERGGAGGTTGGFE